MSCDKHSLAPSPYRCEAISCHTLSTTPAHAPWSLLCKPSDPLADDPAMLIGLALGHVRRSDGLPGQVPASIISRLGAHADRGNPACRLLLDWINHRNRDLVAAAQPDLVRPSRKRRLVRERRQAVPGSLRRRSPKTEEAADRKTAIIAAPKGGDIDG